MYKISYTGDGATTEFPFAFSFFQNADVHVAIDEVLQSDASGIYSVVPNDDFSGGTIVFQTAPAARATMPIDVAALNADFNFLLEAFRDLRTVDVDLTQWANTFDNVKSFLDYNLRVIQDKLSGGGVMGLYNNLVSVLDGALPKLINDYGLITDVAPNENRDDYGIL